MKQIAFSGKLIIFLKLHINVMLLSLNNMSEFKMKRKYFYYDEQLLSTNIDAGLRNKVKFTKN